MARISKCAITVVSENVLFFLHTLFISPSFVIYKNGFSRYALAMNYLLVCLSFTAGLNHCKDVQLIIAVDKEV